MHTILNVLIWWGILFVSVFFLWVTLHTPLSEGREREYDDEEFYREMRRWRTKNSQ